MPLFKTSNLLFCGYLPWHPGGRQTDKRTRALSSAGDMIIKNRRVICRNVVCINITDWRACWVFSGTWDMLGLLGFVLELCLALLTTFSEESVAKLVHRVLLLYVAVQEWESLNFWHWYWSFLTTTIRRSLPTLWVSLWFDSGFCFVGCTVGCVLLHIMKIMKLYVSFMHAVT